MSRGLQLLSISTILVSLAWFLLLGIARHPVQWQYLTVAGVHFIMSIIINRQFVKGKYNYLGIIHGVIMISLGFYGYFFI